MKSKSTRLATMLAAAAFTAASVAGASATEPVRQPATETLLISAGCPVTTGATCTSTRWLGKGAGDSASNFITATTPVDEAVYRADGTINWRDYASDDSIKAGGYALRADQPVTMDVLVSAGVVAANATVHGAVDGVTAAGDAVSFGPDEEVITLVANSKTVSFTFDVPDALDGVVLESLTARVAVHGVNAQGGYIDQKGGSKITIPHWITPAA